jgi:hypothetical protein
LNVSDYADRRVWKRAISTATLVVAESSRHNPAVGMMPQDVHALLDTRDALSAANSFDHAVARDRRPIRLAQYAL